MKDQRKKTFLEVFKKYEPDAQSMNIIERIEEFSYRLNKETREIRINLHFSFLVPKFRLYALEEGIVNAYDLKSCFIFPKYPAELFDSNYKDELLIELSRNTMMVKGFFDDCVMRIENNTVHFDMKPGYSDLPHLAECERLLTEIIFSEFAVQYRVSLHSERFNIEEYNSKARFTMLFDDVVRSDPREKQE